MTTKATQHVVSALKLATEQASTSGTAIDFTGIPAGTTQITVMLEGVSVNGTSYLLIQLGDSGGIETTGYVGGGGLFYETALTGVSALTAGQINYGVFAEGRTINVVATLTLKDATNNTWAMTANIFADDTTDSMQSTLYFKSLSAVLSQIRITTISADTFDAGSINIAYN